MICSYKSIPKDLKGRYKENLNINTKLVCAQKSIDITYLDALNLSINLVMT